MATMNKLLFSAVSFFCFSFLREKEKENELFFVSLHPFLKTQSHKDAKTQSALRLCGFMSEYNDKRLKATTLAILVISH